MKIIHIIPSLNAGGAELALTRLIQHDCKNNYHIVVCLSWSGNQHTLLKNNNVFVYRLNDGGSFKIISLIKLYSFLIKEKPDVLQTWMYHSDLIGGVVGRIAGIKKIIWGIRGPLYKELTSKRTFFIAWLCAKFSNFIPNIIICNSKFALESHINFGYEPKKMTVVYNGFQLTEEPSCKNIIVVNNEEKINEIIIGTVGRFDPHKNHLGLIDALSIVKTAYQTFKFYFIGKDLDSNNKVLIDAIKDRNLESNVCLVGLVEDPDMYYKKLDLFVLSSIAESFPNVIAEAMKYGVPCVSTDVGDVRHIIQDSGWIVSSNNQEKLAESILLAINDFNNSSEWFHRQQKAFQIIKNNFDINLMAKNYNEIWQDDKF